MSVSPPPPPTLPKRFYKTASVAEREGGFGVALDERTLRTPGGTVFVAPTRALAERCAAEWGAQGEFISPPSMPISQLAFAALDLTGKNREQIADYVKAFGETDLCCHRAEAPVDLAAAQAEIWDPVVAWAAGSLDVALPVVAGIVAAPVSEDALARLRRLALELDDFHLTALSQAAGLAGSVLIAFALLRGALTPQQAFEAATFDNLWSLRRWGEDEVARARLERQRAEFEAIGRYLQALK